MLKEAYSQKDQMGVSQDGARLTYEPHGCIGMMRGFGGVFIEEGEDHKPKPVTYHMPKPTSKRMFFETPIPATWSPESHGFLFEEYGLAKFPSLYQPKCSFSCL